MKITVDSPCFNCTNYVSGRYCLAFIKTKIPEKIFLGEEKHDKVIKKQSGKYIFKRI